jgi:hypothetical protein
VGRAASCVDPLTASISRSVKGSCTISKELACRCTWKMDLSRNGSKYFPATYRRYPSLFGKYVTPSTTFTFDYSPVSGVGFGADSKFKMHRGHWKRMIPNKLAVSLAMLKFMLSRGLSYSAFV